MKRESLFLLCVLVAAPALLRSEALYLKDGSLIKGQLVKMVSDTLYFETSYGSRLALHKSEVLRVDFREGLVPQGKTPAGEPAFESAAPGTLSVSFDKFDLSSRIVVDRGGNREAYERENSIEQYLIVDGRKVHAVIDSVTDKTVRNGPKTTLRNDIKPVDFNLAVPSGLHGCVIGFGNSRASAYAEKLDPGPLDKKLVVDPIRVDPGKTTHVRVGLKRKWTGKTELVRID